MLMHTRGILVMTPDSAMVLTGKQALDYSGGVSAEDNFGIGGYDRIMGPNGEAQYWAPDLAGARATSCSTTTSTPTSRPASASRAARDTTDPLDRDVRDEPARAPDSDFTTVGDIFSDETNPDRKKPFDIRALMRAVDRPGPRRRWSAGPAMARRRDRGRLRRPPRRPPGDAASASSRGRCPATAPCPPTAPTSGRRARCSRCRRRRWRAPSTPPAATGRWWCWPTCPASTARPSRCAGCSSSTAPRSAGRSSTSTGRSCCAWSRATTAAPSWCSPATLNDNMEVLAVEGSFASVIGGAPAAAVVFTRDVDARTARRPAGRRARGARWPAPTSDERARLRAELADAADGGAHGEARRGGRRVRRHPQRGAGARGRLGATRSSPPPSSGRTSSRPSSGACRRTLEPGIV